MSLFKRPIFWLALVVWGIGLFLSAATVRAVSGLDARTWPAFTLDPVWTGPVSEWNQGLFITLEVLSYVALLGAGLLWGRVFEYRFGKSGFARIALLGGILSTGGFILHAASWRITMWLEDMGHYIVGSNSLDSILTFTSLSVWYFGGLTFIVFSILAANKMGKR